MSKMYELADKLGEVINDAHVSHTEAVISFAEGNKADAVHYYCAVQGFLNDAATLAGEIEELAHKDKDNE